MHLSNSEKYNDANDRKNRCRQRRHHPKCDATDGLAYRAGSENPDTIRCSVRLKPDYKDSTFKLRWSSMVHLGILLDSSQIPTAAWKRLRRLSLGWHLWGRHIGYQIEPLGSDEFVQKNTDTIIITDGPTRRAVKTISVTSTNGPSCIGCHKWCIHPLISLIYKWSAEDLKSCYSSEYQNDPTTSTEGIRSALKVGKEESTRNLWHKSNRALTKWPIVTTTHTPRNETRIDEVTHVPTATQPAFASQSDSSNDTVSFHDNDEPYDDNGTYR